jgi:cytochrome c oxidase cbb3-type subunit 1
MHPFYMIRALGGIFFLCGALIMVFNIWQTIRQAEVAESDSGLLRPATANQ